MNRTWREVEYQPRFDIAVLELLASSLAAELLLFSRFPVASLILSICEAAPAQLPASGRLPLAVELLLSCRFPLASLILSICEASPTQLPASGRLPLPVEPPLSSRSPVPFRLLVT